MRRCLEAGLLEIRWSELQHRAHLNSRGKLGEESSDMFVPFGVSHLKPAFVVLGVGYSLSSVVFIVELINEAWKQKKLKN
jgi:hypothetical protein